jgi:D-methionine transport system ATP-binding protein
MVEVSGLVKRFPSRDGPVPVLDGVSFCVEPGRALGIVGLSGAGKTTLLRCLALLEAPSAGSIRLGDLVVEMADAAAVRVARQRLGLVFQGYNLLTRRTAAQNVALPLELADWSAGEIRARVERLLALVGMCQRRDAYPAQLSGGERQRIAIARALAREPEVLLCDEATSALDPVTTTSILDLLRQINRSIGTTLIIVTHQIEIVRSFCDEIAVLDQGRIVETGPVATVFERASHPRTRELLQGVTA